MNNKTIDLCVRLPFGVVVTTTMKTVNNSGKCVGSESLTEKMTHGMLENFMDFGVKTIPHLFHISCLTKPITVNGRTFVPLDELNRILKESKECDTVAEYSLSEDHVWFHPSVGIIGLWEFPVILDFFHANHINYRLPEGEYIPVTDSLNPYA